AWPQVARNILCSDKIYCEGNIGVSLGFTSQTSYTNIVFRFPVKPMDIATEFLQDAPYFLFTLLRSRIDYQE
ncbi:Os05g0593150, partial [Oryza sativa Japonica Group]